MQEPDTVRITDFLEETPEDDPIKMNLAAIAAVSGLTVNELINKMKNDTRQKNQTFIGDQVAADTRIITRTNQKEMDAAVASARASIIDEGRQPTNREVAKR